MRFLRAIVFPLLVLAVLLWHGNARAQGTSFPLVSTSVSPTSGTIGARLQLEVTATAPNTAGLAVLMLDVQETTWTIAGEPIIKDSQVKAQGGNSVRQYVYTVIPFATGRLAVPQVAVTYTSVDGLTSNTVLSEPLWVEIDSVLSPGAGEPSLRESHPPAQLPVPRPAIWTAIILVTLVILALAWLLWRRYANHLKRMLGPLRPDEATLKELGKLEDERLIEQKKIKEFYTRLSDSLRHYVYEAYGVHANDLTSSELLRALDELAATVPAAQSQNYKMALARLSEMLAEADLVKFARFTPEASQCRRAIQAGRDVVGLTRYRFVPQEEAQAKGGTSAVGSPPPVPPTQSGNGGGAR